MWFHFIHFLSFPGGVSKANVIWKPWNLSQILTPALWPAASFVGGVRCCFNYVKERTGVRGPTGCVILGKRVSLTQGLWMLPDKVVWSKCPAIWFSINTLSISETNGESWVQSMYPRKEALLPFLYPHGELCLRTSGPGWETFSLLSLWDGSLKPRKRKDKINHKQTMFWRQFLNKQKSKPVLPLCWQDIVSHLLCIFILLQSLPLSISRRNTNLSLRERHQLSEL